MRTCLVLFCMLAPAWAAEPAGWKPGAHRDEVRPAFRFEEQGGKDGRGSLLIETNGRTGLDGWWARQFPVKAGGWYEVRAWRRLTHVAMPHRSANAEVFWLDDQDRVVPTEPVAMQPDFLFDGETAEGWTLVRGAYQAPPRATRAALHLHLRWEANAIARWSAASVTALERAPSRKVRLAAAHYKPRGGKSPADNCRQFAPLVEEAARRKADLLVLGEILTAINNGHNSIEAAEPIPGPSTEYFAGLAKKHNLHIVISIPERDGHLVYNAAVLLGPDGSIMGKYRKTTLPSGEVLEGVAPGNQFPVFETRFGKLGMMICYDLSFPEVAMRLAERGAEVIAVPIYGGNDILAAARAIDNHVYLVTSTYMKPEDKWMRTGIWNHHGELVATASEQGTLAVAEVDLEQKAAWPWLGYFRPRIPRDRPEAPIE